MKALVLEHWSGGHHFNYVECLVRRLAGFCSEVVVATTPYSASSALFTRQLGPLRSLPNVRFDEELPVPRASGRLRFRLSLGRNVLDAITRHKPDLVYLPTADEQVLALPLHALAGARRPRGAAIEALIHYKCFTADANARERLLSAVQCQLLRTGVFARLNFVNFLQFEDAVQRRPPLAKIARAAGDPVPQPARIARALARRALGLDPAGRYVGMVGGLDDRKAVPETLAAFRAAKLRRTDRLLLAGSLAPEWARLVRDEYHDLVRTGTLVVLDRFLTGEELAHAFAALDVHCSVFKSFDGLSSLMLKSIAAGVPVLVCDRPSWARATVRRFGVGHAADVASIDAFSRTLRQALESSAEHWEDEAVGRLLRFHSVENFTEGLVETAAARAGKPPASPVLPWSWVLEALPPERRHLR